MRYNKAKLIEHVYSMLGAPTVLVELDPLAAEAAINRALDKYDEYFTVWRYVNINASQGQQVYDLVVPSQTVTFTDENAGTILNGTDTTTLARLSNKPIQKESIEVKIGTIIGTDNGSGIISGTDIQSGTINYITGQITIKLSSNVTVNTAVLVTYKKEIKEERPVRDVVWVYQINPELNSYWSAFGLLEIPSLDIGKVIEMPLDYYHALRALEDANKLIAKELHYEFYEGRLYLKTYIDGLIAVKCEVEPDLEDIPNNHTALFVDLVQGYLKQILGEIRRKYNNIQVPGGEITLNGSELVTEGKDEVTVVLEKFKAMQGPGFFVVV